MALRIVIGAIGRMKAGPERDLSERYLKRLDQTARPLGWSFEGVREQAEGRAGTVAERRSDEAARLRKTIADPCEIVVLDEGGRTMGSEDFAGWIGRKADLGTERLAFLLGGPDGHDGELLDQASLRLSLGPMTYPHQIARILLAEQLYRAATILTGHPYHRS